MTSRLKRKLGELRVDTSSRRATENFCLIGTPLPPLEKSRDTGEFVPLWKQDVRDDKGRRRLHGAFTGGWSAGYFNTVGSKEGWTPSTFVSSRTDRAKKQAVRPEDFMDEEDLQDIKDNLNLVDTTDQMDFSTQKQNDNETETDPITLSLQNAILPPPKSSIGTKILHKMGWRTGQGIGPRVSLARRRAQDAQACDPFTGTRLTTGSLQIPDEDDEAKKHLYAPRDVPILSVQRKDNTHGLGYVPGTTLHSTSASNSRDASAQKLAGGFGLGALNDADEDDLDVYDGVQHPTSSSSRRHVAYDHTQADDDDTVLIGSSTGRHARNKTPTNSSRDGRAVLQGFILSDEPVAQDKWFPLPDIPTGWKPNPHSVWDANKENANVPAAQPVQVQVQAQSHGMWKSSQLSADQRGSLLGETPLPSGPTKSIFEYISSKDRERIQQIASNLTPNLPSTSTTPIPPPPPPSHHLDPHIAQAALQGFQPFTTDPLKQSRYTTFLQSFLSDSTTPPLQPFPSQTPEEFTKELTDFSKAATLFKPMSSAMQGRFTSASMLDMNALVVEGLSHPSSHPTDEQKKAEMVKEEEEDPKANAAKMGMYGPLTRETKRWVPAKLLCKRFGVREPVDLDLDKDHTTAEEAKVGRSELSMVASSSGVGVGVEAPVAGTGEGGGPRDITNLGLGDDETQGRDILSYQRPSADVFKAIFASDDEDEEEEEEEEREPESEEKPTEGGFTNATVILNDEPVDLETFKPKFVPRSRKEKGKKEKKEKKEKKKDKDKKGKVLISFEMEEEEGVSGTSDGGKKKSKEDRPSKKRRKDKRKGTGDETDANPMRVDETGVVGSTISSDTGVVNRGRKRAVDFMD